MEHIKFELKKERDTDRLILLLEEGSVVSPQEKFYAFEISIVYLFKYLLALEESGSLESAEKVRSLIKIMDAMSNTASQHVLKTKNIPYEDQEYEFSVKTNQDLLDMNHVIIVDDKFITKKNGLLVYVESDGNTYKYDSENETWNVTKQ